jgi:hypothetical protein
VKQGLIRESAAEKSIHRNELDIRKPLAVSISQRSEELRLYDPVLNLSIFKHGLKSVSSNSSSD